MMLGELPNTRERGGSGAGVGPVLELLLKPSSVHVETQRGFCGHRGPCAGASCACLGVQPTPESTLPAATSEDAQGRMPVFASLVKTVVMETPHGLVNLCKHF